MRKIGAFEAKTHFSALLKEVEKGEHIFITKHGRVIAKLVPTIAKDRETISEAISQFKEFNKKHTLGKLDWKTLRDEGRK